MRLAPAILGFLLCGTLGACSLLPGHDAKPREPSPYDEPAEPDGLAPREFTDERTAVTVEAAATALIVAHDEPALAANARDYLSLGVIQVNRMGDYEYYLVAVAWSTIDRGRTRGAAGAPDAPAKLNLRADKTLYTLVAEEGLNPVRDRELYPPPAGSGARKFYRVRADQLVAIAAAKDLQVEVDRGEDGLAIYTPWEKRGFAALQRFVADLIR